MLHHHLNVFGSHSLVMVALHTDKSVFISGLLILNLFPHCEHLHLDQTPML